MPTKLTATKIARLIEEAIRSGKRRKVTDSLSPNLMLQIEKDGRAYWCFRFWDKRAGKERWPSLGPYHTISLDDAREKALKWRKNLRDGKDPKVEHDLAIFHELHKRGLAKTVNEMIDQFLNDKILQPGYSFSRKKNTISQFNIVRRAIGEMPLQAVDTDILLNTVGLKERYFKKPKTTKMILNLLERMFYSAIAGGHYKSANPARWMGHIKAMLPDIERVVKTKHRRSVKYQEIGSFMGDLRSYTDRGLLKRGRTNMALLLEFIVLTGSRTNESVLATWEHINRREKIWAAPPEHHKTGGQTEAPIFRPISKPMLAILDEMERRYPNHTPQDPIFPSDSPHVHGSVSFSLMSGGINDFLKRALKRPDLDAHGFRRTFNEWAKANRYSKDLRDMQLGHKVGDAKDQAYDAEQLVGERRGMMEKYGEYCSRPAPEPVDGTNVEDLEERRRKAAS